MTSLSNSTPTMGALAVQKAEELARDHPLVTHLSWNSGADQLSVDDFNQFARLLWPDETWGPGDPERLLRRAVEDPIEAHRVVRHVLGDGCDIEHWWNSCQGHLATVTVAPVPGFDSRLKASATGSTIALSLMAALATLELTKQHLVGGAA